MIQYAGAAVAAMLLAPSSSAVAGEPQAAGKPAEATICKKVVSPEPGTKPVDMCMTKAEWEAKKRADAKNPNRIVCRYETAGNSRFKSYKVCMTAAEWENQRQLERQAVERIQSGTCVPGAGC